MNPTLAKCPTCGSRKLKLICGDYRTRSRGRPIVVPDVERQDCAVCGEVLLDCSAMERIEAFRHEKRRPARATR